MRLAQRPEASLRRSSEGGRRNRNGEGDMKYFPIILLCGGFVAAPASPQSSAAALDRMIRAGKSQRELAQYLFDTHGCKGLPHPRPAGQARPHEEG